MLTSFYGTRQRNWRWQGIQSCILGEWQHGCCLVSSGLRRRLNPNWLRAVLRSAELTLAISKDDKSTVLARSNIAERECTWLILIPSLSTKLTIRHQRTPAAVGAESELAESVAS